MNAPLVTPTVKPWSAAAFAPRPVARTLRPTTKHVVTPLKTTAPIVWPVARNVKPLPPLMNSDWPAEPFVSDGKGLANNLTGWCAFPVEQQINRHGIARCDSTKRGHRETGRSEYAEPSPVRYAGDDDLPGEWNLLALDTHLNRWCYDRAVEKANARIDTAPLVSAAAKKEPPVLLKIAASADCLHVDPPIITLTAPDCPEPPAPVKAASNGRYKVGDVVNGVTLGRSRYGIIPQCDPREHGVGPVLRRIDGRTGEVVS